MSILFEVVTLCAAINPEDKMPLIRISIIATITFLIDRITKWLVVEWLDLAARFKIEVAPPFLNFVMAWNEGVNFGLFGDSGAATRYFLIVLAMVIVIGLLFWARNKPGWKIPIFAGLIIGGALGNVLDRFIYGAVADFLNMSCCGINNPYAFNIADVAIFAGAFGLILFSDEKTR
ncbi:MAG: signal peptidase II [Paracoccaceae bacterium]